MKALEQFKLELKSIHYSNKNLVKEVIQKEKITLIQIKIPT